MEQERRETVLKMIREWDEPVVSTRDVADHFDISRRTALRWLTELGEEDEIRSKNVGERAKVWYLLEP